MLSTTLKLSHVQFNWDVPTKHTKLSAVLLSEPDHATAIAFYKDEKGRHIILDGKEWLNAAKHCGLKEVAAFQFDSEEDFNNQEPQFLITKSGTMRSCDNLFQDLRTLAYNKVSNIVHRSFAIQIQHKAVEFAKKISHFKNTYGPLNELPEHVLKNIVKWERLKELRDHLNTTVTMENLLQEPKGFLQCIQNKTYDHITFAKEQYMMQFAPDQWTDELLQKAFSAPLSPYSIEQNKDLANRLYDGCIERLEFQQAHNGELEQHSIYLGFIESTRKQDWKDALLKLIKAGTIQQDSPDDVFKIWERGDDIMLDATRFHLVEFCRLLKAKGLVSESYVHHSEHLYSWAARHFTWKGRRGEAKTVKEEIGSRIKSLSSCAHDHES